METENVSDRSNNISVSIGLQNVMDRYGTDQKAIRYNGNIVLETPQNSQENTCTRASFFNLFIYLLYLLSLFTVGTT